MLGEFLDKTASFLDRQFLLAYWFPSLISLLSGLLIYSWPVDWEPLNQYFSALQSGDYSSRLLIIFGSLLLTLILAYLLQAFSHSFVQFWEGYWPKEQWNWYKNHVNKVNENWNDLKEKRKSAALNKSDSYPFLQEKLFYEYPPKEKRLLPTQLGNVLRAAEDYAETTYGMNIVFWWPRLWLILPEAIQKQIDDSLVPIIALLNLTTQIGIVSLFGCGYLCVQYTGPWKFWAFLAAGITLFVGIILAFVAYRGAISKAKIYGALIRSVVDLYRFDLLKSLHQSIPSNLAEERKLWNNLIKWVYLTQPNNAPPYAHDRSKP
jgi:hypothetical protein